MAAPLAELTAVNYRQRYFMKKCMSEGPGVWGAQCRRLPAAPADSHERQGQTTPRPSVLSRPALFIWPKPRAANVRKSRLMFGSTVISRLQRFTINPCTREVHLEGLGFGPSKLLAKDRGAAHIHRHHLTGSWGTETQPRASGKRLPRPSSPSFRNWRRWRRAVKENELTCTWETTSP